MTQPHGDMRVLIGSRIDRLPLTRWHFKSLAVMGFAHFFDAFDSLLIAVTLPVLVVAWHMTPSQIGITVAIGSLGQVIGAVALSALAERHGRIKALQGALALLSITSLATVAVNGLGIFQIIRFIQGIGLGGETPVGATYINEVTPMRSRGRIVFLLQSVFAIGVVMVSVGAFLIIPHFGWRVMFLFGALPLLLAIFLPKLIPESPRWLASKGRTAEAIAIVDAIAGGAERQSGASTATTPVSTGVDANLGGFWVLFSRPYAANTLALWIMALCTALVGYGISIWMPTLYTTIYHLPLKQALGYGFLPPLASLIGGAFGAWLIERLGRRPTFIGGFGGAAVVMAVLASLGPQAGLTYVIAAVTMSSGFMAVLLFGLYAYVPEIYPTSIRAIGAGSASACLRIGAIIGPMLIGFLLEAIGVTAIFWFFAGIAAIGTVTVWAMAPETRGKPLDEIGHAA